MLLYSVRFYVTPPETPQQALNNEVNDGNRWLAANIKLYQCRHNAYSARWSDVTFWRASLLSDVGIFLDDNT